LSGALGKKQAGIGLRLPAQEGLLIPPPTKMQLPHRMFVDAEPRNVLLTVEIDGKQVARRTIRLAPIAR
jgi:hypothetical protein